MWFGRGSRFERIRVSGSACFRELTRKANRVLYWVTVHSRLYQHSLPPWGWTAPSVFKPVSYAADRSECHRRSGLRASQRVMFLGFHAGVVCEAIPAGRSTATV